jgi:hemerythrin-like metal-binding protein
MALIEWRDSYKTGIRSIDYEHENLVWVINDLLDKLSHDCPTDDIVRSLGEIHALIEAHFALEEKVMRDIRYAAYPAHKEDHDRLLDDIREIMENVGGGGDFKKTLGEVVNAWFTVHFSTFDKDFHGLAHRHGED